MTHLRSPIMTTFPSRVSTNTTNLQAAIDLGCVPMERMYETMRDRLPYFGNQVVRPAVGSVYFANYSIAHVPGCWLNALLSAEAATGRPRRYRHPRSADLPRFRRTFCPRQVHRS